LAPGTVIPRRQLEIRIGKLETLKTPKLGLEQYPVSPQAASELLYMAGFEHDSLNGSVIDLGTGTGRLAIGAALMGAKDIVGVDVDKNSIRVAVKNAKASQVVINWTVGDLECIGNSFDAVLMNPPYGTRTPHLDTRFLSKAFELAPITYSIHKSSTREYLREFVKKKGRKIDEVRSLEMRIPHIFDFHKKKLETIQVDLYRIVS